MGMEVNRFEVYLISLDPTKGHEIKKTRPCAIISPNEMNHYISTVIVAEITDFTFDFPSNSYDIPVDLSLVSSGKQEHILPSNLILLDY